jgi:hypothetical protein
LTDRGFYPVLVAQPIERRRGQLDNDVEFLVFERLNAGLLVLEPAEKDVVVRVVSGMAVVGDQRERLPPPGSS